MMNCPYGGIYIDPGSPGDCEVNSVYFNFKSVEEKAAFDAQPDKYEVAIGLMVARFKNSTQVEFYLRDCRDRHLAESGRSPAPYSKSRCRDEFRVITN